MKIRFQNRTSGERIRHLMDSKNIKNAPDLVREMVKDGILEKKKFEGEYLRYTADTINKHLADKQLPDRKWIDLYCDFFDCSADYLMGYIDYPTHSTTNICQDTGLSAPAAGLLQTWNQDKPRYIEIISDLLINPVTTEILNKFIDLYAISDIEKSNSLEALSSIVGKYSQKRRQLDHVKMTEQELDDFGLNGSVVSNIVYLLNKDRDNDRTVTYQEISRLSGNLAESYYQSKAGD